MRKMPGDREPFLLGQRREGRDPLRLIRLRLRVKGQGITKALPAC
jgi:hypothetical protein